MNVWEPKPGHVPPTLRGTIQRMANDLRSGVLAPTGGCTYRYNLDGRPGYKTCIIGARLTSAQIDDLMRRDMGSDPIRLVASHVGSRNVEAQLGMTVGQANVIQHEYDLKDDHAGPRLLRALDELLATGTGYIDGEYFDVRVPA